MKHYELQKEYDTFLRVIDNCATAADFSMACAAQGMADWATKAFFDRVIFNIMFGSERAPLREIKYRFEFRTRRRKLMALYDGLVDSL